MRRNGQHLEHLSLGIQQFKDAAHEAEVTQLRAEHAAARAAAEQEFEAERTAYKATQSIYNAIISSTRNGWLFQISNYSKLWNKRNMPHGPRCV